MTIFILGGGLYQKGKYLPASWRDAANGVSAGLIKIILGNEGSTYISTMTVIVKRRYPGVALRKGFFNKITCIDTKHVSLSLSPVDAII